MKNKHLITITFALCLLPGVLIADQYSGHYFCDDGDEKHVYLETLDNGDKFSIARSDSNFSRYSVWTYDYAIETGTHESSRGGFDFEIQEFSPSGVTLRLMKRGRVEEDCPAFSLSPVPSPLDAFLEATELASGPDYTPETGRHLNEIVRNLPPSGMLPELDQASVSRDFSKAINTFWTGYFDTNRKRLEAMPVETQVEADTLAKAVQVAFPIDMGPGRFLLANSNYHRAYQKMVEGLARRIDLEGLALGRFMEMDQDQLCYVIDHTKGSGFLNGRIFSTLFGRPYPFWDRALAETTIRMLEACPRKGALARRNFMRQYPSIEPAREAYLEERDMLLASRSIISEVRLIVDRLEQMPNTAQTFLETNGYARPALDLPDRVSRELTAEIRGLDEFLTERRDMAVGVMTEWIDQQISFPDEVLFDEAWDRNSAKRTVCGLDQGEMRDILGYRIFSIARKICSERLNQAAERIRLREREEQERLCEKLQSKLDISTKDLKTTLLLRRSGSIFALDNMTLGEFFCRFDERSVINFKTSGFFSRAYKLSAQLRSSPELSTTVTFRLDDDAGGFVVQKIEHSTGGNLEAIDQESAILCLAAPGKRFCR